MNNEICFQHNLMVFTTWGVLRKEKPLLRVFHDNDGDWQFLPGTELDGEEPALVGLGEMVEFDPSVQTLLSLGFGKVAVRANVDSDWVIMEYPPTEPQS